MSWQIRIPWRDRHDALAEAGFLVGEAMGDSQERAITYNVIAELLLSPNVSTVGDALDALESAGPARRRQILDDAREAAGLERSEDIDSRERFQRVQEMARLNSSGRDAEGKALQHCAAERCSALPSDPATGLPTLVADRRWWCPDHRHLAGPDDTQPPTDVAQIGPLFELIPAPSVLREMQAEDERRREEQAQRRRDREAEAEAIRKARERYEEQVAEDDYARPLIAGIRGARMDPR